MSMISVIVPVFAVEGYIEECLRSIMAQSYTDLEILCVNDFTMDNSMTLVKDLAREDSRIKIIANERNRGLGGARNAGLEAATGEYVLFVDSDVTLEADMAEKMLEALEKSHCDAVFCNVNLVNNQGIKEPYLPFHQPDKRKPRYTMPEDIHELIFAWPSAWNKIYKLEIIRTHNIRYMENILYEDHTFYYEYIFHCKTIYCINECLYNYSYVRYGQITRQISPRIFEIFTVIEEVEKVFCKYLPNVQVRSIMC
jgi:glycosyltransferase involved in cell wall biosynthesis